MLAGPSIKQAENSLKWRNPTEYLPKDTHPLYMVTVGCARLWFRRKVTLGGKGEGGGKMKNKKCAICLDTGMIVGGKEKDRGDDSVDLCPYCGTRPIFADRYEGYSILGSGHFSQVILVKDLFRLGIIRAIKLVHKKLLPILQAEASWLDRLQMFDGEGRIGVQKCLEMIEFGSFYGLIVEWLEPIPDCFLYDPAIQGGHLHRITESLNQLRRLVLDVTLLLHTLKNEPFKAIHADIKFENIMWNKQDHRFRVIDFGNCVPMEYLKQYLTTFEIQSLLYRAPEVLAGLEIGDKIDIWSLGVVLLQWILNRKPPFMSTNRSTLLSQIAELVGPFPEKYTEARFYFEAMPLRSSYDQPLHFWKRWRKSTLIRILRISHEPLIDLLASMLESDPDLRISTEDILLHPFLAPLLPFPPSPPPASHFTLQPLPLQSPKTDGLIGGSIDTHDSQFSQLVDEMLTPTSC